MDLAFSQEQMDFREEIARFCNEKLSGARTAETAAEFRREIAEKGWTGLSVPVEYGGLGKGAVHRVIFMEEMAYHQAPLALYDYGVTWSLLGNMLVKHGTEEQRRKYLPMMARAEFFCGQGYSEPEAGNDLTCIQTRAVRDGDGYVVNGQKMWVHEARYYRYTLLMARTRSDVPPENGMSLFVLDNGTAGVSIVPQLAMNGQLTPQVFLDNVRIPAENLVGQENQGWRYYLENKPFYWNKEQGAETGTMRRLFEQVVRYIKTHQTPGRTPYPGELTRQKMARAAAEIRALRHLMYRMAWMEDVGQDLLDISAKARVFHVEAWIRFTDMITQILGRYGQIEPGDEYAALGGTMSRLYPAAALQLLQRAGPSYIKSIIARDVLGMPPAW